MTTDKTKTIASDWRENFPELSSYTPYRLYKITGCLIFGIELIKLPRTQKYRPYFVVYPLWKKNIKECFEIPIVLEQFYDKENFQFDISYQYSKHVLYFNEVSQIIKKQYPFLFQQDASNLPLVNSVNHYTAPERFSIAPLSYFQAELLQVKMEMALYRSASEAQKILNDLKTRNWNSSHFESCGVTLIDWFNFLQSQIDNPDFFLKQIEKNKSNKKIAKIRNQ